ncbi:MAG: hypothetical protein KDB47_13745 [Mycobacterium sp.]|nr:hypothetical protein [Mycobacterium sp.]
MGYPVSPQYPHPPPYPYPYQPPRRNPLDVTISILVMVLIVLLGAAAALMGLFSFAFLDHCPPASCSPAGAITAVMGSLGIAALVGLTGIVWTIVALGRRRTAWPYAVGTLALCLVVLFVGALAYGSAVGG